VVQGLSFKAFGSQLGRGRRPSSERSYQYSVERQDCARPRNIFLLPPASAMLAMDYGSLVAASLGGAAALAHHHRPVAISPALARALFKASGRPALIPAPPGSYVVAAPFQHLRPRRSFGLRFHTGRRDLVLAARACCQPQPAARRRARLLPVPVACTPAWPVVVHARRYSVSRPVGRSGH